MNFGDFGQIFSETHYEVEKIIGRKVERNQIKYKVKWLGTVDLIININVQKGYSSREATWETEENLSPVKDLVDQYEKYWQSKNGKNYQNALKQKGLSISSNNSYITGRSKVSNCENIAKENQQLKSTQYTENISNRQGNMVNEEDSKLKDQEIIISNCERQINGNSKQFQIDELQKKQEEQLKQLQKKREILQNKINKKTYQEKSNVRYSEIVTSKEEQEYIPLGVSKQELLKKQYKYLPSKSAEIHEMSKFIYYQDDLLTVKSDMNKQSCGFMRQILINESVSDKENNNKNFMFQKQEILKGNQDQKRNQISQNKSKSEQLYQIQPLISDSQINLNYLEKCQQEYQQFSLYFQSTANYIQELEKYNKILNNQIQSLQNKINYDNEQIMQLKQNLDNAVEEIDQKNHMQQQQSNFFLCNQCMNNNQHLGNDIQITEKEKIAKIINDQQTCGSLENGDIPITVKRLKQRNNEIFFTIQWKIRETNCFQPQESEVSQFELKSKVPLFLLEYYESKMTFINSKNQN